MTGVGAGVGAGAGAAATGGFGAAITAGAGAGDGAPALVFLFLISSILWCLLSRLRRFALLSFAERARPIGGRVRGRTGVGNRAGEGAGQTGQV